MEQCRCTPQHPHCAKGWRLESESMSAHILLKEATSENWEERNNAFSAAVSRYLQHVADNRSRDIINQAYRI